MGGQIHVTHDTQTKIIVISTIKNKIKIKLITLIKLKTIIMAIITIK